jgi:two-component system, sensor histidine kinase and response regulator
LTAKSRTTSYTNATFAAHTTNLPLLDAYWAYGALLQWRISDQSLRFGPTAHLRKGLELSISIDQEAPQFLRGDPGRIRQILLNLLSNAVKFTAHGDVAVHVNKLSENPKETMLRFEVRDTGIGIPPSKQHLLFQPFTQVDASTTRQFGGTGLGLSIARGLAERMGGTMSLTSTPDPGSTFWFTVRLAKQTSQSKPASERFAALTGTRVLVVDDNANSREILSRQTTTWGMETEVAPSAEVALALLRRAAAAKQPFRAAIIDVLMPEVDGIELARIIRGDPLFAHLEILFISSAGPRKEFAERLKGLDSVPWLSKPISQSALYDALSTLLSEALAEQGATDGSNKHPKHAAPSALPPRLKMLIAEDNPVNQKLAKLQLKKLGLEADVVGNGIEAVEAATRLPYDVILMDCQMPEMDGYDATREIRRRQGTERHTTIVAMTAHALEGDREKCLAAGMDGYISKPVNPRALEKVLIELISKKTETAAADNAKASAGPAARGEKAMNQTHATAALCGPALDPVTMATLREEGADVLAELIDMFLIDAPLRMKNARAAFERGDAAAITFEMHRLKGGAANFGAHELVKQCQAIELAGRAGDVAGAKRLYDLVGTEFDRVIAELGAERAACETAGATKQ